MTSGPRPCHRTIIKHRSKSHPNKTKQITRERARVRALNAIKNVSILALTQPAKKGNTQRALDLDALDALTTRGSAPSHPHAIHVTTERRAS